MEIGEIHKSLVVFPKTEHRKTERRACRSRRRELPRAIQLHRRPDIFKSAAPAQRGKIAPARAGFVWSARRAGETEPHLAPGRASQPVADHGGMAGGGISAVK